MDGHVVGFDGCTSYCRCLPELCTKTEWLLKTMVCTSSIFPSRRLNLNSFLITNEHYVHLKDRTRKTDLKGEFPGRTLEVTRPLILRSR